jgi:uncharacterized protein (TIGR02246 family)
MPRLLVVVALGSALVPCRCSVAGEAEATVRKLAHEYIQSVRVDRPTPRARLAALWADDLIAVWSDGTLIEGKEAFLERHAKAMAEVRQQFAAFAFTLTVRSVTLAGDRAILFGRIAGAGVMKKGRQRFRRDAWLTLVAKRTDAGWVLCREHSSRAATVEDEEF